jgi:hypothetical protein
MRLSVLSPEIVSFTLSTIEHQKLGFANLKPRGNNTADVLELLGWAHISKLVLTPRIIRNAWIHSDPLCFTNRKLHWNSGCQSIRQRKPYQLFLWLYYTEEAYSAVFLFWYSNCISEYQWNTCPWFRCDAGHNMNAFGILREGGKGRQAFKGRSRTLPNETIWKKEQVKNEN